MDGLLNPGPGRSVNNYPNFCVRNKRTSTFTLPFDAPHMESSPRAAGPSLVLFDVVGTLVNSYDFDTELFVQAVREVTGMVVSGDWGSYTFVSDGGVLQEEIARQGLPGNADEWEEKVKKRFTELTREHLQSLNGNLEKPGARAFVEQLLGRGGAQHEQRARRRLLERLEQRVGGRGGQRRRLLDQEHADRTFVRWHPEPRDDLVADALDRDDLGGALADERHDVGVDAPRDLRARVTYAAAVGCGAAGGLEAAQRHREGDASIVHRGAAGAGEQVRVRDSTALDRSPKLSDHAILARDPCPDRHGHTLPRRAVVSGGGTRSQEMGSDPIPGQLSGGWTG